MKIVLTGSIATDHLMSYSGKLTDSILPDSLDKLSVVFLVDDLVINRGGTAGNIAFGLGTLGRSPVLVGAVGDDFDDYRAWLDAKGVDTASVLVSPTGHTPPLYLHHRRRRPTDRRVLPGGDERRPRDRARPGRRADRRHRPARGQPERPRGDASPHR